MPANPSRFPKLFFDLRSSVNGRKKNYINYENHIELTEWIQCQIDNNLINSITADNALTKSSKNNVQFGGPLLKDTSVTGEFSLDFTGLTDVTLDLTNDFKVEVDADIDFDAGTSIDLNAIGNMALHSNTIHLHSGSYIRIDAGTEGGNWGTANQVILNKQIAGANGHLEWADISGIALVTADNGLSTPDFSYEVELGGTLNKETIISGKQNMFFSGQDGFAVSTDGTLNNPDILRFGNSFPTYLLQSQDRDIQLRALGQSIELEGNIIVNTVSGTGSINDILINKGSGVLDWGVIQNLANTDLIQVSEPRTYNAGGQNLTFSAIDSFSLTAANGLVLTSANALTLTGSGIVFAPPGGLGSANQIWTNQGSGVGEWQTLQITSADTHEITTSAAGSNVITAPTKPFKTVNKTAITGGGDTDTLPDTAGLTVGQVFILKDQSQTAGTNNWTIATFGAETIDGAATISLTLDGQSYTIQWDGTTYNII